MGLLLLNSRIAFRSQLLRFGVVWGHRFSSFSFVFLMFFNDFRSWTVLGGLGWSWSLLGRSWVVLGRSWGALGASWGALGSPWVALGVLLGCSGGSWGSYFAPLGASFHDLYVDRSASIRW